MTGPRKRRPAEEVETGRAFYAEFAPDLEIGHFAAMWHIFSVGHLVATDLDRVARRHGLSIADLLLLGTLRIHEPQALRATDLALKLYVSNAVLSARVARLERMGLLSRAASLSDKRSFELTATPEGSARADAAIADISRNGQFVRQYRRLPEGDQAEVARLLGRLHDLMDRDFTPTPRKSI